MRLADNDTLVLCYHAVSDSWEASQSVPGRVLASELELLLRRGYEPVRFSQAVERAGEPGRRLAVTFDDGYRSVLDRAAPILEAMRVPGTLFVPTDFVGERRASWDGLERWYGGPHEPELGMLGWAELRQLAARGWEIGSHGCSHLSLTACGNDELRRELEVSRAACEQHLDAECRVLAYPFGHVDERVERAVIEAGYRYAGAIPVRLTQPRPLSWPRIGIYHRDGLHPWHFRLKVSPTARRLRATPLWSLYGRARRALVGR